MGYTNENVGYQSHSQTSKYAAESCNALRQRQAIMKWLEESGEYGMTGDEIAESMGQPIGTASARLSDLKDSGYVVAILATRKTRRGKSGHVNILKSLWNESMGRAEDKVKKPSAADKLKIFKSKLKEVPQFKPLNPYELRDLMKDPAVARFEKHVEWKTKMKLLELV